MKRKYFHVNTYSVIMAIALPICMMSCLKNTDTPLAISEPAGIVSFNDLSDLLKGSNAKLFAEAVQRSGLDTALKSGGSAYTLLAPSDAAMQAAGLTQTVIRSLPIDSLINLVRYHILPGSFNDTVLNEATLHVKTSTLMNIPATPPVYDPTIPRREGYPLPVFIKYYAGHGLYVNDTRVSNEKPTRASNGFMYQTQKVILQPFNKTVFDFISSQPDLSMYLAALKIVDSINADNYNTDFNVPGDTVLFKRQGIFINNIVNYTWLPGNSFTIFAPTNAAFAVAGFHTIDDILDFVAIPVSSSTYQSPMDSILRRHVVFNRDNVNATKTALLYGDLQFNSMAVNTAKMNTYIKSYFEGWDGGNFMKLAPLQFSATDGVPYIKWSSQPNRPLVPVPDEDPAAALPNHFIGHNGTVYKVNTLFFRD